MWMKERNTGELAGRELGEETAQADVLASAYHHYRSAGWSLLAYMCIRVYTKWIRVLSRVGGHSSMYVLQFNIPPIRMYLWDAFDLEESKANLFCLHL